MAAVQRGRRMYYQRWKAGWRKRMQRRKILGRRRKLYAKRRRGATKAKYVRRYVRGNYRRKPLPTSRYLKRVPRNKVLSSQKARSNISPSRKRVYHRKPAKVGRPRKKKLYSRGRAGLLRSKLKAKVGRKHAKNTGASGEKKPRKKRRSSEEEIFYSLGNSVRFNTPSNTKNKETESLPQDEMTCDNQQNQQAMIPKKRGRPSATSPICKTR